jgi:hypothetical protein
VFWNRWKIPSARKCYLCSRYILLLMSPGRTFEMWRTGTELNRRRQPFQAKINSDYNDFVARMALEVVDS